MRFIVFALTLELLGCGASGLELQARAAHVASEAITQGGELIRDQRREEQRKAVLNSHTQIEAALVVSQIREKWEPIVNAYEALRASFVVYLDALALAAADEDATIDYLKLLGDVLHAWRYVESLEAVLEIDIPSPPEALMGFVHEGP